MVAQARLRTADGGEVAYLRVHFFASETTRAVQAALIAGEQDGVDGYVLDLRNNPGALRRHQHSPRKHPTQACWSTGCQCRPHPVTPCCNIALVAAAGGVFEEAIAIATLLLDPDCAVAETVRIADLIDNTYQV